MHPVLSQHDTQFPLWLILLEHLTQHSQVANSYNAVHTPSHWPHDYYTLEVLNFWDSALKQSLFVLWFFLEVSKKNVVRVLHLIQSEMHFFSILAVSFILEWPFYFCRGVDLGNGYYHHSSLTLLLIKVILLRLQERDVFHHSIAIISKNSKIAVISLALIQLQAKCNCQLLNQSGRLLPTSRT